MTQPAHLITQLLGQAGDDPDARARLMTLVYDHLKHIAGRQMSGERADHTLSATGLVHEAYLELFADSPPSWADRAHFFAYAARVMRHVLVHHARARQALKRGGGMIRVTLEGLPDTQDDLDLTALDEALTRLATLDPRKSDLVELRFFGGLSIDELTEVTQLAPSTIHKELKAARGWLYDALEGET